MTRILAFLCLLSSVAFGAPEAVMIDTKTHKIVNPFENFNGALQVVVTRSDGKLPALDGSLLTNLPIGGFTFTDSLVNTGGTITLVGDTASPGNSKYYGSNGSGTLGYFDLPSGGAVDSVFGRTGVVVAVSGDYTAAQVTNAADTTGSYANPSWITSLIWSKITSTPTTLSGYGITDAVPSTRTVNSHALSSNVTLTTADVSDSTDKRYVTDAQRTVLGNTSGTNTGDQDLSGLVTKTTTVNSHALSSNVTVTASDVGLGSVTNDAQTKAAIVPNTAPSAGQLLAGNAGGTAYAPVTLSGSGATATLSSAGVLTLSAIANATLSNSAITIAGTSTALGGSITLDTITGVSSNGFIKRTGANTLTNDNSTYLTGNQTITLSGDVSGSGATSITTTMEHSVTLAVDGAGTVLTTGTKNPIKIPFGGTLQGWVMMCKPSGSVTADILRAADGAGLPSTSIVGGSGTKPAISSAVENSSTSFTSWTSVTLTAKDNLAISLSGVSTATYVQLTLYYR
jgi:hypothetical protein